MSCFSGCDLHLVEDSCYFAKISRKFQLFATLKSYLLINVYKGKIFAVLCEISLSFEKVILIGY